MVTEVPIPFFGDAPVEYDQSYFAQLTRNFALYTQQMSNPGPIRGTTIVMTNLPVFANNTAAVSGGLAVNSVYKTSGGELRIVV
tara:strand:- start:164 stop:415 length:252 start_codon:yes stop_codon:yes gene_type:complete